jgi:hypothetical protein
MVGRQMRKGTKSTQLTMYRRLTIAHRFVGGIRGEYEHAVREADG